MWITWSMSRRADRRLARWIGPPTIRPSGPNSGTRRRGHCRKWRRAGGDRRRGTTMRRVDRSAFRYASSAACIGLAVALAGCASAWPNTVAARDAAMGIQPNSVPANLLRPDGVMINGLLPAQWANEL